MSGRPKVWAGAAGKLDFYPLGWGDWRGGHLRSLADLSGGGGLSSVEALDRWMCWGPRLSAEGGPAWCWLRCLNGRGRVHLESLGLVRSSGFSSVKLALCHLARAWFFSVGQGLSPAGAAEGRLRPQCWAVAGVLSVLMAFNY